MKYYHFTRLSTNHIVIKNCNTRFIKKWRREEKKQMNGCVKKEIPFYKKKICFIYKVCKIIIQPLKRIIFLWTLMKAEDESYKSNPAYTEHAIALIHAGKQHRIKGYINFHSSFRRSFGVRAHARCSPLGRNTHISSQSLPIITIVSCPPPTQNSNSWRRTVGIHSNMNQKQGQMPIKITR